MQADDIPFLESDFSKASCKLSNGAFGLAIGVESLGIHCVYVDWLIARDFRVVEVPENGRSVHTLTLLESLFYHEIKSLVGMSRPSSRLKTILKLVTGLAVCSNMSSGMSCVC